MDGHKQGKPPSYRVAEAIVVFVAGYELRSSDVDDLFWMSLKELAHQRVSL